MNSFLGFIFTSIISSVTKVSERGNDMCVLYIIKTNYQQ